MKHLVIMAISASLISCATKEDRQEMQQSQASLAGTNVNEKKTATALEANVVSTISFKKGAVALDKKAQKKLDSIISEAKSKGTIETIELAVWSDQEYPTGNDRLPNEQVRLAKERARNLQKVLAEKEKDAKISVHSMATQPSAFAEIFNTKDAKLKSQMEEAGLAPSKGSKVSSAIVMIKLK